MTKYIIDIQRIQTLLMAQYPVITGVSLNAWFEIYTDRDLTDIERTKLENVIKYPLIKSDQ